MSRYIIKRILYIILVALIITLILFFLYKSIPGGDYARLMAYVDQSLKTSNPEAYIIQLRQAEIDLGINEPFVVQYFMWLWQTIQGNFGYTLQSQQNWLSMILPRLSKPHHLPLFHRLRSQHLNQNQLFSKSLLIQLEF